MCIRDRGYNDKVYLFHNSSSTPLWEYTAANYITSIAISSDGNYIIASTSPAGNYAWAYLFHKSSSTPLWSFSTNTDWIRNVAISANGSYVVVVSDRVFFFEKSSSTPLWVYATGGLNALAISDDGNYIVAGGGYPSTYVYFFHKSSSTPLWIHSCPQVWSAAISSDGNYIVTGDHGGTVRLFEKSNSIPIWTYAVSDSIWSVSISKNGKYIGAGSEYGNVYFFENTSSTPLWSYKAGALVRSVKMSDCGDYMLVGSEDFKAYFFGASSNMTFWTYETGGKILSVDISSKGNYSVVGSFDSNIYYFYESNDNSPPSITNIMITNDPLDSGDTQTITCDITDNTGILNASADIESPDENKLSTLNLYDDGTHGDINSGDGIFTTTWDSLGYSEGTYYVDIKAIDSSSPRNEEIIDNGASFTLQDANAPLITNILVSDNPLEYGNIQTISCQANDPSGISSITAYFQNSAEMTVSSLDMFDDGAHNDSAAGDGVYGANWDSSVAIMNGTYYVDIIAYDNSTLLNQAYINNAVSFLLQGVPLSKEPSGEPTIFGYNLIILIGAISLIVTNIIIKKRK